MKNRSWFILLPLLCLGPFLAAQDGPYHRIRIDLTDGQLPRVAALGLEVDHGVLVPGLYLENDFSAAEIARLEEAGLAYRTIIPNVQVHYTRRQGGSTAARGPGDCEPAGGGTAHPYPVPSHFRLGTMGGFYTYEDALAIFDTMRMLFPQLITSLRPIAGHASYEGRPIFWLRLSDNPDTDEASEPEVLYTAVHHAREPNSLTQMVYYLWYLLENYGTDPEVTYLVDHTALYFVPVINPDGYLFNEAILPSGGGLWRKNRRPHGNGSHGVDLNRNYGYEWGYDNIGSSPNNMSETYRGAAPFSEPETQAVRAFCEDHAFLVALNYHTYGNYLIYPWGYSDTPTPDAPTFNALAQVMTQENGYLAGTGTETINYVTNGDSDDWMYGEAVTKPRIFSMTPEVGDDEGGFWPSVDAIVPNCQASLWMNLAAANAPHVAGSLRADPTQLAIDVNHPFLHYELQRFGLTDGPLTVTLEALHPGVTIVDDSQIHLLPANESVRDSFTLELSNGLMVGEELYFVLGLDNGQFVRRDTIRRIYNNLLPTAQLADSFAEVDQWQLNGSWNLTEEDFVTPSFSLTDSPYADYGASTFADVVLDNTLQLAPAESYQLSFWAKWEIEAFYDWAQVAVQINGGGWIPLCGRYTVIGSDFQDSGQPVYDGQQGEWVREVIDLGDLVHAGDALRFRFRMASDNFIEGDGFYVDDFRVEGLDPADPTAVASARNEELAVRTSPNPARIGHGLHLMIRGAATPVRYCELFNAQGQRVLHQVLSPATGEVAAELPTSTLQAGVYWLVVQSDGQRSTPRRIILVK